MITCGESSWDTSILYSSMGHFHVLEIKSCMRGDITFVIDGGLQAPTYGTGVLSPVCFGSQVAQTEQAKSNTSRPDNRGRH